MLTFIGRRTRTRDHRDAGNRHPGMRRIIQCGTSRSPVGPRRSTEFVPDTTQKVYAAGLRPVKTAFPWPFARLCRLQIAFP